MQEILKSLIEDAMTLNKKVWTDWHIFPQTIYYI